MPDSNELYSLICHPATPAPMVRDLDALVKFLPNGGLFLSYCLRGDMARLLIPPESSPVRTDLLWEHTCFEAFVGAFGDAAYREFNFSPSGQWAAYAFSDYRQRDKSFDMVTAPQITTRRFAGRLELEAILTPEALPSGATMLQIGLSAVVESADTIDGRHSYWALRHPAIRPDFHCRDAFTLELAVPCPFV